jgi:hypothetical protein
LVLAFRAYHLHVAEERVREAEAKLDREDPRWRWDDILADRAPVPEDENSARPILAAAELLPKNWPQGPAAPAREPGALVKTVGERMTDTPLNQRLDRELAADLRAQLKALAPALAAAQPLTHLPRGRYEITWTRDYLGTRVPHLQKARDVTQVFALEAARQADEGNISQAFVAIRGALNTGRSVGDEPLLLSLLVRYACGNVALKSLQRVLAQGETSPQELAEMQRQLRREAEESEPLLRHSLRAERAEFYALAGLLASGEFGMHYLEGLSNSGPHEETWWSSFQSWLYLRPLARYNQAAILDWMTEAVDITRLPASAQGEAFVELSARMKQRKATERHLFLALLLIPATEKVAIAAHRYRASLDYAQVALAAERFRRERGRWPETLAELVPRYLDRVPEDPFDGAPLRYRRTAEGVKVFSVGPDRREGTDEPPPGTKPGTDLGFQLWDVKQRRR